MSLPLRENSSDATCNLPLTKAPVLGKNLDPEACDLASVPVEVLRTGVVMLFSSLALLALALSLSLAQQTACQSGDWTETGHLNRQRYLHTATELQNDIELPNGIVLVAGGLGGDDTAELYNSSQGTWTFTASMSTTRMDHTASLIVPTGTVLVAGGFSGAASLRTAELYNASAGAWTLTGMLNAARYRHTSTLLITGDVLVAGGIDVGDLDTAELYDYTTGKWTYTTGRLITARSSHTATLLPTEDVLVVGGCNAGRFLASTELYSPATRGWTSAGTMVTERYGHTATLLLNCNVLVVGGKNATFLDSVEIYVLVAGNWTTTGNLNYGRYSHTASLLSNGEVLVAGGSNETTLRSAELYNPFTGTWTVTGSMITPRVYHTASLLPRGKVLVASGLATNTAECYINCGKGIVLGDPHFVGFNGCRFNFDGEDNTVYAIYSDVDLQVNALLKRMSVRGVDGTWMTKIGIRTPDAAITFDPSVGLLNMDDMELIIATEEEEVVSFNTTKVQLSMEDDDDDGMKMISGMTVSTMGARIRIDVKRFGSHLSEDFFLNIEFVLTSEPVHPHGILGQTAIDVNSADDAADCSHPVMGVDEDYVVSDGMAGTRFVFQQFQDGDVVVTPQAHVAKRSSLPVSMSMTGGFRSTSS